MGWERTPSNHELGGRARAAAERDGRGRLATGGGDEREVGWARGACRRRAPSSLADPPGNFGASPRWGVRAGPGGRSDAPSRLRAEDEVAATAARAWPRELRVAPGESWCAPARAWKTLGPRAASLPGFLWPFRNPCGSGVPNPAWPRVHGF